MMKSSSHNRKVLFVDRKATAKGLLGMLQSKLGCDGEVAASGEEALAIVSQEDFDAILLDLRSIDTPPEEVVSGIHEIRPSLIGRVLIISGEVDDPETLDLMEHYFLLKIPRNRLISDLVGCLRALLCIPPSRDELGTCLRHAQN